MKQPQIIKLALIAILWGITGCDLHDKFYLESKVSLAKWDDLAPHFNLEPYYIEIKGHSNIIPLRLALSVYQNNKVTYRVDLGHINKITNSEKNQHEIDSKAVVFLEQKDDKIIGSWRTYTYGENGLFGERGNIDIPKDKLKLTKKGGYTILKTDFRELEKRGESPLVILHFEDLKLPPSFGLETVFLNNPDATLLVISIVNGNMDS